MTSVNILALVLAGGEGTRLRPLTAEHAKPALPFANGCRIVDFVLSNFTNSGISSIYVLAQYKPQSLIRHIQTTWSSHDGDWAVNVVLPGLGAEPFLGTADAVFRNLDLIERHRPDLVAVFAADHVYRMDVRQMIEFHLSHDADVSVAAVPVPIEKASSFGIIVSDHGNRILDFQEKPGRPASLPEDPNRAYASMGNYLFSTRFLVDALCRANRRGEMDFGRHVLPDASRSHRAFAYDFTGNRVPGVRSHEEPAYWRDVGTLEAYTEARRDTLGPQPRFRLENSLWPIRTIRNNKRRRQQSPYSNGRGGFLTHMDARHEHEEGRGLTCMHLAALEGTPSRRANDGVPG
jgi:glucose-1-phosphate adenylyltransferase